MPATPSSPQVPSGTFTASALYAKLLQIKATLLFGDRRAALMAISPAQTVAGHFDIYICRRDDSPRGRGPEEVPQMLRQALLDADVDDSKIEVIIDEQAAINRILSLARPGDLLLIFADAIERGWKQITQFETGGGDPHSQPTVAIPIEQVSVMRLSRYSMFSARTASSTRSPSRCRSSGSASTSISANSSPP